MRRAVVSLLLFASFVGAIGCNDTRANSTPTTKIEAPKEPPQPIGGGRKMGSE